MTGTDLDRTGTGQGRVRGRTGRGLELDLMDQGQDWEWLGTALGRDRAGLGQVRDGSGTGRAVCAAPPARRGGATRRPRPARRPGARTQYNWFVCSRGQTEVLMETRRVPPSLMIRHYYNLLVNGPRRV